MREDLYVYIAYLKPQFSAIIAVLQIDGERLKPSRTKSVFLALRVPLLVAVATPLCVVFLDIFLSLC